MMTYVFLFAFHFMALKTFGSDLFDLEYYQNFYEDEDYINSFEQGFISNDKSTPPPPLYRKGGPQDIRIDRIPICYDEPDNVDCGSVYINIIALQNQEKIYMKDVGYLHLDYATEENGIHSLVYSGEGDVTAYFTYSGNTIVGTIHRKDGKVLKILSISDQKQVMSLIDLTKSTKREDNDEDDDWFYDEEKGEIIDLEGEFQLSSKYNKKDNLNSIQKQLLTEGEKDLHSIVKVKVTVYYNEDAEKMMMSIPPEIYIRSKIDEANHGYRESDVPIKLVLHEFEKSSTDIVSDKNLSQACNKSIDQLRDKEAWDTFDYSKKMKKCQQSIVGEFRQFKGPKGKYIEQAERVRMGANIAILLIHEISGRPDFCGQASRLWDVGRRMGLNLAVVSLAGACEYTFGHEIGHLLGLSHQKTGGDSNKYFLYGHGYSIPKKDKDIEGTRTVMAKASGRYQRRLNVYSNPRQGTGTTDMEDNARALRESRFLAAFTDNANIPSLKYTFQTHTKQCRSSAQCLPLKSCTDQMTPRTFLKNICGDGKVCCEKSPGCSGQYPEIEHKQTGWFMFGNRQHNHTLSIGDMNPDETYRSVVELMEKGSTKQMWKWDGEFLVSKFNQEYVFDCSLSPCTVAKKTKSMFQHFRFSNGYLVTLGSCSEITVRGGMSIARRWYRIEVDEEDKENNNNLRANKQLSINTYICDQEEQCTDIIHCYEAVIPTRMNTKFCDKDKVCCKTKVCHNIKQFEDTETPVNGWFVIESQMNQMLLTVKIKENLRNQQVVNSNPRKDMKGQVWMWKEDNIVSQLDTNLVLDGSFGKVSVNNKKHGNIYQKWRKSDGFFVNAGHCEVLDVAYGNKENDALITIWAVHDLSHQKWMTKPIVD